MMEDLFFQQLWPTWPVNRAGSAGVASAGFIDHLQLL